jgi:hypothetical protein
VLSVGQDEAVIEVRRKPDGAERVWWRRCLAEV